MAGGAVSDSTWKQRRPHVEREPAHAGRRLGILFAGTLAALPAAALADGPQPSAVVLSWQAPANGDCASADEIRERVARLSQRSLTLADRAQHFHIRVDVAEHDAHWRARVTLVGPDGAQRGVREVGARTPGCRALDVPSALVIATMLDGLPAQPPPSAPPESPAGSDAGETRTGVGVLAVAAAGLGPDFWFGAGLTLELPLALPVALEASAYAPAEQTDALGRGARAWGFHAGVAVCPRLVRSGALELRACGAAHGGATSAEGVGLSQSSSALLPLFMVGLGPMLSIEFADGFAVQVASSVAWLAVRSQFHWDIEGQPRGTLQGRPVVLLARIGVIGFPP